MATAIQKKSKKEFESLMEHLRMIAKAAGTPEKRKAWKYTCSEDFVLKHGKRFAPCDLPLDIKPGREKMCFQNCLDVAVLRRSLHYVEGYAMGIIPVMHCWLVDSDGCVIDPTWTGGKDRAPLGTCYFGVEFRTDYVIDLALRSGYVGVIDNMYSGFELLKGISEHTWRP